MSSSVWYIYGAGGLGMEVMDMLHHALSQRPELYRDSRPSTIKFMEDNPSQQFIQGIEVCDASLLNENDVVTIAVGEPDSRTKIRKKCQSLGVKLASVFSANAYISEYSLVGNGAIIAPFCSIQATSVIGDNVLINSSSIIGHDVRVEKDSVISSAVNIGGNTHIGFASFLGMGTQVKERLSVGDEVIVSMGSVVTRDLSDSVIAVGNPARVVKKNLDKKIFRT